MKKLLRNDTYEKKMFKITEVSILIMERLVLVQLITKLIN